MSWVTIIWSMTAAVCLTLALIHLRVWFNNRQAWANLAFAVAAAAVMGVIVGEYSVMRARTPAEIGTALRWVDVPVFVLVAALVYFVQLEFRMARTWVGLAALGLRFLSLVLNFTSGATDNYREITAVRQVGFLGEPVSVVATAVLNPWGHVSEVSMLVLLIFVVEAVGRSWQAGGRENRRRARLIGCAMVGFVFVSALSSALTDNLLVQMPYLISLPFLAIVLVMNYELSGDVIRAARLSGELRESEERLRQAAEASGFGAYRYDLVSGKAFYSPESLALFGLPPDATIEQGPDMVPKAVHPDDKALFLTASMQSSDPHGFGTFDADFRVLGKDGRLRWLRARGRTVFDGDGQTRRPVRAIGILQDITRRKQSQEDLAQLQRQNELILNSTAEGILGLDLQGNHIFVNPAAARMLGYEVEELLGRRSHGIWHHTRADGSPYPEEDCKIYASSVDGKVHRESNEVFWRKDGSNFPVEYVSTPVYEQGRLLGAVVTFEDSTARKRAEEALKESEARFRMVANTAPVLIWMAGSDKLCEFFNKSWLDFTGRGLEQELGNGWAEGVHPDDLAGCLKIYDESFEARQPFTMEYRLRRHDGEYRWISDHGVPHYDAERNFLGYIGSCVDLTERKQAEAELLRQRAELAHVARVSTMGELAASVAHELNQPLGAILANSEAAELFLQQDPPALDDLRAILADIRKDDERAGEVIRRMRALLRKRELEQELLEINPLVEDVLQLVSGDAALRGISLAAELFAGMPKISGDRVHLQQVLLNLILNGMDSMAGQPRERRRILVRTRFGADGRVELAVIDSGHGIEPDKLERLFEPFYTTKPNGMGMGLSISRTIIEAHHGRIWAENNAAGGAVFRVTLPAANEEQGSGFGVQVSGGR